MKKKQGKKSVFAVIEDSFTAAGLSEGDPSTAKRWLESVNPEILNSSLPALYGKIRGMLQTAENVFAAAAMAEGGPELAFDFLESREPQTTGQTFHSFLRDIGLQGVRVQYCLATV